MFNPPNHINGATPRTPAGSPASGSPLSATSTEPQRWITHWSNLERLGCASKLVESAIFRLRDLDSELRNGREISPQTEREGGVSFATTSLASQTAQIDESLTQFTSFMGELRKLRFSQGLVGESFSDNLFLYFCSSRTVEDFFSFRDATPLPAGYTQLHAKLFSQEIDHYIAQLESSLSGPDIPEPPTLNDDDMTLFVDMLVDRVVYLPSPKWIAVIRVCRQLVDAGILQQESFLRVTHALGEQLSADDPALETLYDSAVSLRGPFAPEAHDSLCEFGASLAKKRSWQEVFKRPFIRSNPTTELGYYSELLYRLVDFNREHRDKVATLIQSTLHHHTLAQHISNDSSWRMESVSRVQASLVKIMENYDSQFALDSLHAAHQALLEEWNDTATLWRGATLGVVWGEPTVQHTFLRYLLQNRHAVASLKAILNEATNPLGATYQLVVGLRQIIRDRQSGATTSFCRSNTLRALQLLAHTGRDGLAAAPEVFRLLGISVYQNALSGALISPPWPAIMDSEPDIRRRARALIQQWEEKFGPRSRTISHKLARYDEMFAA